MTATSTDYGEREHVQAITLEHAVAILSAYRREVRARSERQAEQAEATR